MKIIYDKDEINIAYKASIHAKTSKYDEEIKEIKKRKNDFLDKVAIQDIEYYVNKYPMIMRYILYKIEYEESLDKIPENYINILSNEYGALILDGSFYGYFTELYNIMTINVDEYIFFFYRFLYEEILNKKLKHDQNILEALIEDFDYPSKSYINNYYKYLQHEVCGYGNLVDTVKEINGLSKDHCIEVKQKGINRVGYDYRACKLTDIFIHNVIIQIIENENNCREIIRRGFKVALMDYKLKNKAK